MKPLPAFLPPSLLAAAKRQTFLVHDCLFSVGDAVQSVYWIARGEVLAVRPAAKGADAVMFRACAGEFFALASLYMPAYTCTGIASKPCVTLSLPLTVVQQALQHDPQFADQLLRHTVSSLRKQCSRVERLRLRTASERIQHYLSCETQGDGCCQIEMPLSEWAIDLGLEPETLYRTLRVLEENGVVKRDKKRMRLCVAPALSDLEKTQS